jgi:hypothetical protein
MNTRRITAFVLAALVVPSTSLAGTIVLPAMLNDGSADPKKVEGVRQLVSSELEFASGVDAVKETSSAGLSDACFSDPRCMAGIAKAGGGDQVLAGKVSQAGNGLTIDFVFFDGGTISRRKQYQVPLDSTAMSNAMTPIVAEMITGRNAGNEAAASAALDDFDDIPEDDSMAVVAPIPAYVPPPQPAYVPPPQPAYVPPPQPAYVPPPQPAYVPPPQPAYVPPPASADDAANMISFGNSAAEISVEEVDAMIQFGTPSQASTYTPPPQQYQQPPPQQYQPPPQPVYQPPPQQQYQQPYQPQPVYQDPALAREEALANQAPKVQNLDDEPNKRSGGSSGSNGKIERDVANTMQISFRGGYSKYFVFDFATVGAELAVPVYDGLHLLAGVEGYAVNRVLPPELQRATGIYSEWNTIFPANIGAMYKFTPKGSIAQPYVGGDVIFAQYYKDEIGSDWAGGARLRGGLDIMIVKNFGLNLNVGVGGWTGKNWSLIENGLQQSGLLPQASGGTVIAF